MLKNRIMSWFARHWKTLNSRPTNGHSAMLEIDKLLTDIATDKTRICMAVKDTKADTAEIEEMRKLFLNANSVKDR